MSMYGHHKSYSDGLAHKRRRRFFIRLSLVGAVVISIAGFIIYGFFYSGWLDITSVSITGFKTINENELSQIINSTIADKKAPLIGERYGKNIYLFNPDTIKTSILTQYPIIKDVAVKKTYPHKISVEVTERTPFGTWCFGDNCSYFDEDGILWGKAIKSSGSLLLTVEDNRQYLEYPDRLDKNLLENIRKAMTGLEKMNIKTAKVTIEADSINDFHIYTTAGYYVIFSGELSVDAQTDVLKIFLDEKGRDFKPTEYVDLRIEGRVYYK